LDKTAILGLSFDDQVRLSETSRRSSKKLKSPSEYQGAFTRYREVYASLLEELHEEELLGLKATIASRVR
jgi:hypothetical protein